MKKMEKMKNVFFIFAIGFVFILAACGQTAADGGAEETEATESSLQEIQDAGVIVVGITGGYSPSNYHENGDGDLVGYDVETILEVVADIPGDIEVQFEEMSYSALLPALESGRVDTVIHSMGRNADREEKFNFTIPYFEKTLGVIVGEDSGLKTLDDLNGKRAAQSVSTSTGKIAEDLGATIVPIETIAEAVDLVMQDRADFYIGNVTGQIDFMKKNEGLAVRLMEETMPAPEPAGIMLQKRADSLTEAMNVSIEENTEDGTIGEIFTRYVGYDSSVGGEDPSAALNR